MSEHLVGVDEAGRGPLAGPVAVGCVQIPKRYTSKVKRMCVSIRGKDSKKLTEKAREEWYARMQEMRQAELLDFTVTLVGPKIVDRINVSKATRVGIRRVLHRLNTPVDAQVLLDGSLCAPIRYENQQTIVKGDEKELCIGLASIAAKVTRDRFMARIDEKFPEYGFAQHKGYGTLSHRRAINELGPTTHHRLTFIKK